MGLDFIEGEQLSGVWFVMDYLQLQFNSSLLTLYHWPEVFIPAGLQLPEGSYAFGDPGYRDALCSEIAENVETTSIEEGVALEISFEDGTIFRSSLREEDYEGPEAGTFTTGVAGDPMMVF